MEEGPFHADAILCLHLLQDVVKRIIRIIEAIAVLVGVTYHFPIREFEGHAFRQVNIGYEPSLPILVQHSPPTLQRAKMRCRTVGELCKRVINAHFRSLFSFDLLQV